MITANSGHLSIWIQENSCLKNTKNKIQILMPQSLRKLSRSREEGRKAKDEQILINEKTSAML